MKKCLILILSYLITAQSFEAQCDPNILNNHMTGCAPLEITFNAPANVQATWAMSTATLNGTTATYVFPAPAVYIVTLTTVTNGTCFGKATLTVTAVTGPANGCTTTILGLQNISSETECLIFPNPCTAHLNISIPGVDPKNETSYIITDSHGRKIREDGLNSNFISTYELAPGLYFIQIRTKSGTVTKKFIKSA